MHASKRGAPLTWPRAAAAAAAAPAAASAGCDGVVVGLPVTQAGSLRNRASDSQQGRRCRNFAVAVAALAHVRGLEVLLVDERGTTQQALEAMRAASGRGRGRDVQQRKDSVAAALLLSAYFDAPAEAQRVKPPGLRRGGGALQGERGGGGGGS
jgi:RNase H-fold protein (predicted Holliday junction resolvase)